MAMRGSQAGGAMKEPERQEEPQAPPADAVQRGKGVLVSGTLNDIHSLGLYVLEQALTRLGYRIVRLGTMITQEEFIAAARETAADAILVSDSNGHAEIDFEGLGDKCREAGLEDIYIYAGGMLTVVAEEQSRVAEVLRHNGVRRVFPPGSELNDILAAIDADLALKRAEGEGATSPFPHREGARG